MKNDPKTWKKLGKEVFTPERFGVTYDGGKFIKEFLNAQMYVDMGLQSTGDPTIDEKNQQLWTEKVKPFFDHVEEILNTL